MSTYAISAGYQPTVTDRRATGLFFGLWVLVALTVTAGALAVLGVVTLKLALLLPASVLALVAAYGAGFYWLSK